MGFELLKIVIWIEVVKLCANWAMRHMSNRRLKKKDVNAYIKIRDVGGDEPP